MSCMVSFSSGLLLVKKQPIKWLGIDPLTYCCRKPSNTNNKYFNTNESCLHLSKKKIIHRKFPVIRATSQLAESIKDENEKDIFTGKNREFKYLSDFERLRKNEIDGVDLQVAIVSYHKKLPGSILQPGLQVALVGCLHFADKEFYAHLQQELDNYDRVLYEGITDKDPLKESNRNPETRYIPPEGCAQNSIHITSILQNLVSSFLGLYTQGDCLDYRRDNWYNADLDMDTYNLMLCEAKKKCVDSILAKETSDKSSEANTFTPIDESLEMEPSSFTTAMKLRYAQMSESTEDMLDSVVIEERNKVVMEELRAAMNDGCKKIAILYGTGHMPDMDRRLRTEFDLVPTQVSWKTAWAIRNQKTSGQIQLPFLQFFLILTILMALVVNIKDILESGLKWSCNFLQGDGANSSH